MSPVTRVKEPQSPNLVRVSVDWEEQGRRGKGCRRAGAVGMGSEARG